MIISLEFTPVVCGCAGHVASFVTPFSVLLPSLNFPASAPLPLHPPSWMPIVLQMSQVVCVSAEKCPSLLLFMLSLLLHYVYILKTLDKATIPPQTLYLRERIFQFVVHRLELACNQR